MRASIILATLVLLPLAACGDDKEGTTISINAQGADGNVVGGIDGNGQVAIDVPGFSGKLTLPKLHLDGGDFDLNGVKLYPGSKISNLNIMAHEGKKDGDDHGTVRVTFDSPADPATVRDWFADKLGKADFTLRKDGMALVGTDEEKKPFRLELQPAANGHATGTIVAGG